MGYKRDGKKLLHDDIEWTKWHKENAGLIKASGLPEMVVLNADHWYDFLDHAYLDHHEDLLHFHVDNLTIRQKAFLLQLVAGNSKDLTSILGLDLLADLISAVKERYRE